MLTFRVLSALISYPTPEMAAALREAEQILVTEGIVTGPALEDLRAFLRRQAEVPQLDAEAAYLEAFDRGRSTSLYLFEHIHGESRDRGQAMVRLIARYRMHGLDVQARELPDYLPLFLEFLSVCRPPEARKYLAEVVDIVAAVGERLRRRRVPHAAVLEAIASLVPARRPAGDAGEAAAMLDERDDLPAALDAAWEEAPVTFDDAALRSTEARMAAMAGAARPAGGAGKA